jgi:glycosyltransferase involved in cell wall biosynthesis
MIDGAQIRLVGELNDKAKGDLLRGAAALLFPIDWPEPFGLVMIEAMACGTPVIAFRRGSVPEVVDNGVTGFVVDDEAGAVAAIRRIRQLDRRRIRATFERRFTATRMAEDYLRHYVGLLQRKTLRVPIRLQPAALADHHAEVGTRLSPDDSGIVGGGSETP